MKSRFPNPSTANSEMMAMKRRERNRRNALKSTGPKTAAGKAIVAQNKTTHGLRSQQQLILPGESAAEFETLRETLLTSLNPEGSMEETLVERLLGSLWKLRRLDRLSNEMFSQCQKVDLMNPEGEGSFRFFQSPEDVHRFDVFRRYEVSTEKSFYRALHELQRLQAKRCGEVVSLPTVVDINFMN